MQITRISRISGKTHTREIPCTQDQYNRWMGGALIQIAMPNVSSEDREFILTGTTPEEWKAMWGDSEEAEEI